MSFWMYSLIINVIYIFSEKLGLYILWVISEFLVTVVLLWFKTNS